MPLGKVVLYSSVMSSGVCALGYYLIQSEYPANCLRHGLFLTLFPCSSIIGNTSHALCRLARRRGLFLETSTPFISVAFFLSYNPSFLGATSANKSVAGGNGSLQYHESSISMNPHRRMRSGGKIYLGRNRRQPPGPQCLCPSP